ncbi:MAG: hypothetical protein U5Q44_00675 [Dehalococcoidia bacterium]|nr:hypothetical protein [Dehalococcoidia bacterium]
MTAAGPRYENVEESWNTALQLASAVGRLKIASNLKAVNDAQQAAFHEAGRACALIGDANMREGGSQAPAFRDARGALARCGASAPRGGRARPGTSRRNRRSRTSWSWWNRRRSR